MQRSDKLDFAKRVGIACLLISLSALAEFFRTRHGVKPEWFAFYLIAQVLFAMAGIAFFVWAISGKLSVDAKRIRRWFCEDSSARFGSRFRKIAAASAVVLLLVVFTVAKFAIRKTDPYKLAVATARQNPQFTQVLGERTEEGWDVGWAFEWSSPPKVELSIPVQGLRAGKLSVVAFRVNGRWHLTKLVLQPEDSGNVDLLSR